ncbi:MAG: hypothetical protein JWO07_788 [Candidatus Saccharibacteria bacterium]|nr:hypothetical protein [Candidatus Saccharibacteria bacterium]
MLTSLKEAIASGMYVGGQLEIRPLYQGYMSRAEIESIALTGIGPDEVLTVTFAWCAVLDDRNEWVVSKREVYTLPLYPSYVEFIGLDRFVLQGPCNNSGPRHIVTLHPPVTQELSQEMLKEPITTW